MSVFDYMDRSSNVRIAVAPHMPDMQWRAFCEANALEFINAYPALKQKYSEATAAERTSLKLIVRSYIAGIISPSAQANLTPAAAWNNAVLAESRRQWEVAHGQDRKSFWEEFKDGAMKIWPVAILGMNIPAVNAAYQIASAVAAINQQPFAELVTDAATGVTTAQTTAATPITMNEIRQLAKKYALPIAAVLILVILLGRL